MSAPSTARLNRNGIRYIARELALTAIILVLLLAVALDVSWINAWVNFGLVIGYQVINFLVLYHFNPQILNDRGTVFKANTKRFDKIFAVFFLILGFIIPLVAGLDKRFALSPMDWIVSIFGIGLFICSCALGMWAMAVNAGFEVSVRIQEDRGHLVCTTGPYRFIRHPGYAAEILATPAYIFILGSWWALLPAVAFITLFIVRTSLEDKTLQQELLGYKDYAARTKYRLIPFIW